MVEPSTLRALARALPETVEQDHHGRPSFRVAGRIFATFRDTTHANVMLDAPGILTAVQAHPQACAEFRWGQRLAAVQVDLRTTTAGLLAELLEDAWERKAPKRLLVERSTGTDDPTT